MQEQIRAEYGISIRQPLLSALIGCGRGILWRNFRTNYRGWLALQASSQGNPSQRREDLAALPARLHMKCPDLHVLERAPRGCIYAAAKVAATGPGEEVWPEAARLHFTEDELEEWETASWLRSAGNAGDAWRKGYRGRRNFLILTDVTPTCPMRVMGSMSMFKLVGCPLVVLAESDPMPWRLTNQTTKEGL